MSTEIQAIILRVYRQEYSRILATLIDQLHDFELAEEALQDAFEAAMVTWPKTKIPQRPGAWLTTTAKNKAIDRIRHHRTLSFDPQDTADMPAGNWLVEADLDNLDDIPDERLKLMFTCCHPALSSEQQVALTLHTLGGLSTSDIAAAFLIAKTTMAQRLVRAKRKIKQAGIPYYVPPAHLLTERLSGVLTVIYLIFTEGYATTSGNVLVQQDLCDHAIYLCRTLEHLIRKHETDVSNAQYAEVLGLLALMLLSHARREARIGDDGRLVLLSEQVRERWDQRMIQEGLALVEKALYLRSVGPYQVQAAIGALHAEAKQANETDWVQIVALYKTLVQLQDNTITRLNYAVAVSMAHGPEFGLGLLEPLADELADYAPYHLAQADLLTRLGDQPKARMALQQALSLTQNDIERAFIVEKLQQIPE
ncbi:MAG: RNA polymerase sigma factor [Chloroflexota bacterium]